MAQSEGIPPLYLVSEPSLPHPRPTDSRIDVWLHFRDSRVDAVSHRLWFTPLPPSPPSGVTPHPVFPLVSIFSTMSWPLEVPPSGNTNTLRYFPVPHGFVSKVAASLSCICSFFPYLLSSSLTWITKVCLFILLIPLNHLYVHYFPSIAAKTDFFPFWNS